MEARPKQEPETPQTPQTIVATITEGDPTTENKLTAATKDVELVAKEAFKLSRRRWLVLVGLCVFGFLNGLTNELYAILGTLVELMQISIQEYVYLSQLFFYIIPILGIPTAWFVDRYGFKITIYSALGLVIVRNSARALLFSPKTIYWQEMRFLYWFLYNILVQLIVLVYYCLPLKVSENWFPEKERSVAWNLMIVFPIFGSACASLTVPQYVTSAHSTQPLAYVNLIATLISTLTIFVCITKSKPKHAPSKRGLSSAQVSSQSMRRNLRTLLGDKNVLIQLISLACFDTFVVTINSILQDVLAASGFSQIQTGQFLATMAISSVILQSFSSFFLSPIEDEECKTSPRKCKLYMLAICLTFLLYSVALALRNYPSQQWWLAMLASLAYTLLRFWAAPSYNDLLAHLISGSISQATVGAAQMILQALLSVLFSVLFVYLRQLEPNPFNDGANADGPSLANEDSMRPNYLKSIIFLATCAVLATLLYLFAFDGRKTEKSSPTEKKEASKC